MKILQDKCKKCLVCIGVCPVKAIFEKDCKEVQIDRNKCIECGCCASICPNKAIEYE